MPLKISIFGSLVSIFLAGLIAFLSSENNLIIFGIPSLIFCAIYSFGVHWFFFIHGYLYQTEHYFDVTGSFTYISLSLILIISSILSANENGFNLYSLIIGSMVIIWALRLGSFLFKRVKEVGKDVRFIEMKKDFFWFLMTWTLSGLWVFLTYAAGLLAMSSISIETSFSYYQYFCLIIGSIVWIFGITIEVISDHQKKIFRQNISNKGKFIKSGLWSLSRHPNYLGEIILWLGISIIALPTMDGFKYIVLISPVFVYILLTKISGIPMLEKSSDAKWGDNPDYIEYKKNTPVLFFKKPNL
jgi:steroid 5-alpha reductase family enzyme